MTTCVDLRLRVTALTHVGLRRQSNEDCIAIERTILSEPMNEPWLSVQPLEPACACLVADGMGGHPAGEVASRAAIEAMLAGLPRAQTDRAGMSELLHAANAFLFEEMARCPQWLGMGTTLAGIVANRQHVVAFNVGDSRIYRIQDGELQQLSVDHSEAVGMGFFFSRLPARVLSQCLGGFPDASEIDPHVIELPATAGAEYLICSDGLYDMLPDAAIARCLQPDPVRSVQALFEAAMDEGGIDNVSIILARLEQATAAGS